MIRRVRQGLFVLAFAASVVVGTALVFRLIRPGTISRVGTPELVALLGLLLLPPAAAWAFLADGGGRSATAESRGGGPRPGRWKSGRQNAPCSRRDMVAAPAIRGRRSAGRPRRTRAAVRHARKNSPPRAGP